MNLAIIGLLTCSLVAVYSDPQLYSHNSNFPWSSSYFRKGITAPEQAPADGRFFFATQYFTVATTTLTSTITETTKCTTSTAALRLCVASTSTTTSGRRRRDAPKDGYKLYYVEPNFDNIDDIFLPSKEIEPRAAEPVEAPKETPAVYVPFVVQPGFMAQSQPQFRFLAAFTTATATVLTTTTSISTLTAICMSTSNFQLCSISGK